MPGGGHRLVQILLGKRHLNMASVHLKILLLLTALRVAMGTSPVLGAIWYPPDVIEDSDLDTEQLIRKYKYPAETHFATTTDGYVLRLHRIAKPGGKPILLQHGLLDSSATYILMGPEKALGYYFYDQGYDVWLGNARGNRYSRNHTALNPDTDREFWNFSWHEIGVHDIPAMIDYILDKTNSEKLYYVGHSQGTTALFVMCSMRPEYNQKISLAHALAPVAFMKHIRTPLLGYAMSYLKIRTNYNSELLPRSTTYRRMCLSGKTMQEMCLDGLFQVMGKNVQQFNRTAVPKILGHVPAGVSLKQVNHYMQLIKSDRFCQYDYDQLNQKIYGQSTPPDYDLTKVTAPVALHYGLNDYLAEPVDVLRLCDLLPNKFEVNKMEMPLWNHLDFIWGIDARKLLYQHMEELNLKIAENGV